MDGMAAMTRRRISTVALTLGVMAGTGAGAGQALAADVTLTLTGVQARGGQLLVGLQTRDQFLRHQSAYGERIAAPTAGVHTLTFHDVAPGAYSVSVLHDLDGDGKMRMADGHPAEGWTMLNAASLRSAPTFDQVSFTVSATSDARLDAAMHYPGGDAPPGL